MSVAAMAYSPPNLFLYTPAAGPAPAETSTAIFLADHGDTPVPAGVHPARTVIQDHDLLLSLIADLQASLGGLGIRQTLTLLVTRSAVEQLYQELLPAGGDTTHADMWAALVGTAPGAGPTQGSVLQQLYAEVVPNGTAATAAAMWSELAGVASGSVGPTNLPAGTTLTKPPGFPSLLPGELLVSARLTVQLGEEKVTSFKVYNGDALLPCEFWSTYWNGSQVNHTTQGWGLTHPSLMDDDPTTGINYSQLECTDLTLKLVTPTAATSLHLTFSAPVADTANLTLRFSLGAVERTDSVQLSNSWSGWYALASL